MDNLKEEVNYNDEPVFYCERCMSLRIRFVNGLSNSEYCDNCGSTEINQSNIEDWRQQFKDKYGYDHLEEY